MDKNPIIEEKNINTEIEQVQKTSVENSMNQNLGEMRYEKISESIGNAKKRLGSLFRSGASGLGRLLKRGAIGVLNTPESIPRNINAGKEFISEKTTEGIQFVKDKTTEGVQFVGDKVDQSAEWVDTKFTNVYDFSSEKYNDAKNFVGEKAEQVKDYVGDKALLVEAVASLALEKTGEKLDAAKTGIKNGYNTVMEYGENAINSANLKAQEVKEKFNSKKNALIRSILERRMEIQKEKATKALNKLSQLEKFSSKFAI